MTLTLGISPCPNDTFIFDALLHGKVDTEGISFEAVMEDVEQLNQHALQQTLDVTKLSFGVLPHVFDNYALLDSGAALGKGVGPILVTRKGHPLTQADVLQDALKTATVAIPGEYTTAHQLLKTFAPKATSKKEMHFAKIADAILHGKVDAGLMIHEGRFTYQEKGLELLLDLGTWWELTTDLPLPLGGIVIKRTYDDAIFQKVNRTIRRSLQYAWDNYPKLSPFVIQHAQEMNEEVMRSHINLYVNDYTYTLGNLGKAGVAKLCGITL